MFDYRMRSGFASVAVLACLTLAGMNLSASGEAEFVLVEVALENAIAGSDTGTCNYYTKASTPDNNSYCCQKTCNELDTCGMTPFVSC